MVPAVFRRKMPKMLFCALLLVGALFFLFVLAPSYRKTAKGPSNTPQHGCLEKSRFPLQQNGDYWIHNDFIRAQYGKLRGNESLTLTTHATYMDFKHLEWLLARWGAPISMAVYVDKKNFEQTLLSLYHIKYCTLMGFSFFNWVSVQLVFHEQQMPTHLRSLSETRPVNLRCTSAPYEPIAGGKFQPASASHPDSDAVTNYPLHLLKNVARLNAQTYYVISLDLAVLPTRNFVHNFFGLVQLQRLPQPFKSVYCVPIFPQLANQPLPKYKSELLAQLQSHINDSLPLSEQEQLLQKWDWLLRPLQDGEMAVFERTKESNLCAAYVSVNAYEPFYDLRHAESCYDQNCTRLQVLKSLNFDFIVLDGTFLIKRLEPNSKRVHSLSVPSTGDTYFMPSRMDQMRQLIKLHALTLWPTADFY